MILGVQNRAETEKKTQPGPVKKATNPQRRRVQNQTQTERVREIERKELMSAQMHAEKKATAS